MELLDQNKIWLFILFVTPGFVCLKLYEIFFPSAKTPSQQMIDLVAHSVINYAILSIPIVLFLQSKYRESLILYVSFGVFCIFIFPVLLAVGVKFVRNTNFMQNHMPHPVDSAWNYYFSQRQACYLIVVFKDGARVGGFFGPNSFATNTPGPMQLYVEREWVLNDEGAFEREAESSKGLLLLMADVVRIEFFEA